MTKARFWLAVRCWLFHPVGTLRAWRMLHGRDQHYVGTVNGIHCVAITEKIKDQSNDQR